MDEYILKQYDDELLRFSMRIDVLNGLEIQLKEINTRNEMFLPKDLELSDNGIRQWLQKRIIPKSRAFVHEILKSLGLSSNDLKGIIDVCKGLSLNDSYWVVPANFNGLFADYNLYENKFDKVLSNLFSYRL